MALCVKRQPRQPVGSQVAPQFDKLGSAWPFADVLHRTAGCAGTRQRGVKPAQYLNGFDGAQIANKAIGDVRVAVEQDARRG